MKRKWNLIKLIQTHHHQLKVSPLQNLALIIALQTAFQSFARSPASPIFVPRVSSMSLIHYYVGYPLLYLPGIRSPLLFFLNHQGIWCEHSISFSRHGPVYEAVFSMYRPGIMYFLLIYSCHSKNDFVMFKFKKLYSTYCQPLTAVDFKLSVTDLKEFCQTFKLTSYHKKTKCQQLTNYS